LINLANMEIILFTPNLYIHLHDAAVVVHFLIGGFVELVGQFKI